MAQSEILGLFGLTPESYQQAQRAADQSAAFQFAQLNPLQAARMSAFQAGQGIGRGFGSLLGVEDPQLRMIAQQQQILRNVDQNDPESIAAGARMAAEMGNPRLAAALGDLQRRAIESQALTEQRAAEAGLRQGQLQSLQMTQARENQLQQALGQLPENASEEQIQTVLRRYGDPKTVLQAIERRSTIQAQAEERRRMEAEKAERRAAEAERDREFRREMAQLNMGLRSATNDLQRQLLQEKIDTARQKKQDAIDKQLASAEGVVQGTEIVLNKIDEAQKLLGVTTTGFGSILSVVPGTPAKELANTLGTIKARLGFDQLQQMRNASPTGGALGQVAVKELEALQSAIASLDQAQDAKTLEKNLNQIKSSYSNWRNAALGKIGKQPEGQSPTPVPSPAPQPKPTKRFNPVTGRLEDI